MRLMGLFLDRSACCILLLVLGINDYHENAMGSLGVASAAFTTTSFVPSFRHVDKEYTSSNHHHRTPLFQSSLSKDDRSTDNSKNDGNDQGSSGGGGVRQLMKEKVKRMAKSVMDASKPSAIKAAVLLPMRTTSASASSSREVLEQEATYLGEEALCLDEISLQKTNVADALLSAEKAIDQSSLALKQAKEALVLAKQEASMALQLAERAARQASDTAERATELAISKKLYTMADIDELAYEDVDFHLCEMSPPFLDETSCLVPGEPVVRVEKAPENSRRIFAGIDIPVSVDHIWEILTDYTNLQKVVPNLVVNEVLEYFDGDVENSDDDDDEEEDLVGNGVMEGDDDVQEQCRLLASKMKGSKLRQVGGAKVVGINFSARTTLEVREWPRGLPDFAHFQDEMYDGLSREERYKLYQSQKLERYKFPRPFALSQLPTKDISMQSLENDDGEFRLYQGVWRMQPLPGCAPDGENAMRLTYAVEISPRPYLPVGLVEGRISQDLCNNLCAIRDYVTQSQ